PAHPFRNSQPHLQIKFHGVDPLSLLRSLQKRNRWPDFTPPEAGTIPPLPWTNFAPPLSDSPLFVATWYTIAVSMLAVIGALAASRLARW
ncbi:DUF1109 family protein, partial [Phyllobacterium salinisoli]